MDNPAGLAAVLKKHGGSKGPLYIALAQATATLTERLSLLSEKVREERREVEGREQEVQATVQEMARLQRELQATTERLATAREVLDRADMLSGLGFGLAELSRLRGIMAQIAASQGAAPEDGVAQFFETVARYERVVSLDLEAKRAEARAAQARAEADRWDTEAKREEAHSKARIATIDLVEKLLDKGVKEWDLPQWSKILEKAGVAPEALAKALEHYGSLEQLCHDRQQQAGKLDRQVRETEARLKALQAEEAEAKAGIAAIRDGALAEMAKMSRQASQHLATLMSQVKGYGELQRQAAQLEGYVVLARAFKDRNEEQWARVSRAVVEDLLVGLIFWSRGEGRNVRLAPPPGITKTSQVSSWDRVALEDLLVWAFTGVFTAAEQKALAAGR